MPRKNTLKKKKGSRVTTVWIGPGCRINNYSSSSSAITFVFSCLFCNSLSWGFHYPIRNASCSQYSAAMYIYLQNLVSAGKSMLWEQLLLLTDSSGFRLVVHALNDTIIIPHLQQSSILTLWESVTSYNK